MVGSYCRTKQSDTILKCTRACAERDVFRVRYVSTRAHFVDMLTKRLRKPVRASLVDSALARKVSLP